MTLTKLKPLLIEMLWLLLAAIITLSICYLLFGREIFQNRIDINLHDTYFVTQSAPILIIFFIAMCFIIFLIKEKKHACKRRLQNIITIIFGLALLISFSQMISIISVFTSFEKLLQSSAGQRVGNGWSVNPPLEIHHKSNSFETFKPFEMLSYFVMFLQLTVVLLIIRLCYKWGKQN